jgi:raffinose/stachyose/melibiose transport system substrate-binding protein
MRRIGALSAGILAALTVGVAATAAGREATVTLKMLQPLEQQNQYQIMVANFERVYPDIKIEVTYVPFVQYVSLLLTEIQAGNAPDLFFANAGNNDTGSIYPLASNGKLLDLTGSPWQKRLPAFARPYFSRHGKIYGWPVTMSAQGLLYNADLFQSLGLKQPQNFAGLLALCRQITAAGKIPIAVGLASLNSVLGLATVAESDFVYNKDPKWTIERNQKKVTFAGSPLWNRGLQAIVDMKNAGCFQPAPAATTTNGQQTLFTSGQAVMELGLNTQRGQLLVLSPSLNLRFMLVPADNAKDTVIPLATPVSIVASATTQHPKEAKTFINFLARAKQSSLYASVGGGIAPFDAIKGVLPSWLSNLRPFLQKGRTVLQPSYSFPRSDIFVAGLVSPIVGLFTGQRSVSDILANLDKVWDTRPA